MNLPVFLTLALRYLRPRRTFVSAITVISILGVTLGVMVLILVISVMTGFDRELRKKILAVQSHLVITAGTPMDDWEKTMRTLEAHPQVRAVAPFILGTVMIKHRRQVFTPSLKGVDAVREAAASSLERYVVDGKFRLDGNRILVGKELSDRHGISVGDRITVYSPRNMESTTHVMHLPDELTVSGIFQSGMFMYDIGFVFCSLETAQDLFELDGRVHGLSVMTEDMDRVQQVKLELNRVLKFPLHTSTWIELNPRLFSAIAVEKNMMFFLLIFIVIVAAFGITSNLITVTVQKTREIGVLKAIGATPSTILTIFLTHGMIVGVIGTGLGLGCGLTLLHYRNEFLEFLRVRTGFELFPREIYHFEQLPAVTSPQDLAIICLSALVICTLAGLLPAWRASRLEPGRALREL